MSQELPSPAFYSLLDAAEILNAHFHTNKFNINYLINLSLTHDLYLHFVSKGWPISSVCDFYFSFEKPSDEDTSETAKNFRIKEKELKTWIKDCLTFKSEIEGGLLQVLRMHVPKLTKELSVISTDDFGSFMIYSDGFRESNKMLLQAIIDRSNNSLKGYVDDIHFYMISASYVTDIDESKDETLLELVPKPTLKYSYEDNKKILKRVYCPLITREDIVITSFSLEKIKNNQLMLLDDNWIPDHHIPMSTSRKSKPIGVSPLKRLAQEAAKTLATYLWQQDKEQQIKIKDMAINVYGALYTTEHVSQLPDKAESLRDWIKDVAPEYARASGRPPSK